MHDYGYNSAEATQNLEFFPRILSLLPSAPCHIVEVGCGNGYAANSLHELGYQVTALDTSESGIGIARVAHPGVSFQVASASDELPECDVVLSIEVIEHLTDPARFIERSYSALKKGGTIVITTPYHGYLKNLALSVTNRWDSHFGVDWVGGHIKFFSERTLTAMLCAAGFSNITFHNAGRVPYLWKSIICKAIR